MFESLESLMIQQFNDSIIQGFVSRLPLEKLSLIV